MRSIAELNTFGSLIRLRAGAGLVDVEAAAGGSARLSTAPGGIVVLGIGTGAFMASGEGLVSIDAAGGGILVPAGGTIPGMITAPEASSTPRGIGVSTAGMGDEDGRIGGGPFQPGSISVGGPKLSALAVLTIHWAYHLLLQSLLGLRLLGLGLMIQLG